MQGIAGTVPCSICGEYPVLQGGKRLGRLACPNYKDKNLRHGNLGYDTRGLPMGFTKWCYYFWSDDQIQNEGMPTIINDWNNIHSK